MAQLQGKWYQKVLCCLYAGVLPLAEGQPGIAKSQIILALADKLGRNVVYFNGGRATDSDVEIVLPNSTEGNIKYRMSANEVFHECKAHYDKTNEWTLVIIDEATDMVGLTQLAFQGLVTEMLLEGGKLNIREAVRFCMIGNPPEMSTSGNQQSIPMVTRQVRIEVPVDVDQHIEYLRAGRRGAAILDSFGPPNPDAVEYELNKLDLSLASFLSTQDHTKVLTIPADTEARMRPWANPRTTSYMNEVLAVARAVGLPDGAQVELASGAVGEEFAVAFLAYFKDLDIPDVLPMILGTAPVAPPFERGDRLVAFTYSLAVVARRELERALKAGKKVEAKKLWAGAVAVLKAISAHAPDTGTLAAKVFAQLQAAHSAELELGDAFDSMHAILHQAGRI